MRPEDGVPNLAIWERDGWKCLMPTCLCPEGRTIMPDQPHNSLWQATIDHIVPRSEGGADIASNKRSAHAACNNREGGPRGSEIMRERRRQSVLEYVASHPGTSAIEITDALGGAPGIMGEILRECEESGQARKIKRQRKWRWYTTETDKDMVKEEG